MRYHINKIKYIKMLLYNHAIATKSDQPNKNYPFFRYKIHKNIKQMRRVIF